MRVAFGCGPPTWANTMLPGQARRRVSSTSTHVAVGDPVRPQHYPVAQTRAHGQSDAVDAAVRWPAQRGRRAAQLGQELVSAFQAGPVECLAVLGHIALRPGVIRHLGTRVRGRDTAAGSARARLPTIKNIAFAARRCKIRSTCGVHCLAGPSSMVRATNRADGAVRYVTVTVAVYAAGPGGLAGGSGHARACPCSGGSPVSICGTPARSSLRTGHPGMSRTRSTTSRAAASTATWPGCTPPPGGSAHGSPAGWARVAFPCRPVLSASPTLAARSSPARPPAAPGTQTPGPGPRLTGAGRPGAGEAAGPAYWGAVNERVTNPKRGVVDHILTGSAVPSRCEHGASAAEPG